MLKINGINPLRASVITSQGGIINQELTRSRSFYPGVQYKFGNYLDVESLAF